MSAFKVVPKTGVILVNQLAAKHGFYRGHPDFCNLGQGQPETGFIEGGIERITDIHIDELDQEYAPVGGLKELRQAIADMYNELYRKDKGQKYTADNVSVAAGGRAALTRLAASIDNINLGHFLPDYTAYEELLTTFILSRGSEKRNPRQRALRTFDLQPVQPNRRYHLRQTTQRLG
jgi:aspartate/methionine/tyrosine aminotransferase